MDRRVHRLVLETYVGDRPAGMECRHLDGDKLNNNLSNLVWGNKSDNEKDAWKHSRAKKRGMGNSKLTYSDIRKIRKLYARGKTTQRKIGEVFGTHHSTISLIVKNKTWTWVI